MTTSTTPTEQFTAFAQRGQDAVNTAVRTWTEIVQRYVTAFTPETAMPTATDAKAVVNAYYDVAAQVLAGQRAFASELVDTGAKAADALVAQLRARSAA